MGKKGKKATHGGKKKTKQSQHIPPSVNENNNDNGICQEVVDELDFIKKDKRGQFCNEIINEKLLLPNKPRMTNDPLAMKQKLLSIPTNERTATAERLIKAQSMMDDIEKIQLGQQTLITLNTNKDKVYKFSKMTFQIRLLEKDKQTCEKVKHKLLE